MRKRTCTKYERDLFPIDDNRKYIPINFSLWNNKEPNNFAKLEYNVVMTLDKSKNDRLVDGRWNDVANSSLFHSVCEYSNDYIKEIGLNETSTWTLFHSEEFESSKLLLKKFIIFNLLFEKICYLKKCLRTGSMIVL